MKTEYFYAKTHISCHIINTKKAFIAGISLPQQMPFWSNNVLF